MSATKSVRRKPRRAHTTERPKWVKNLGLVVRITCYPQLFFFGLLMIFFVTKAPQPLSFFTNMVSWTVFVAHFVALGLLAFGYHRWQTQKWGTFPPATLLAGCGLLIATVPLNPTFFLGSPDEAILRFLIVANRIDFAVAVVIVAQAGYTALRQYRSLA